MSPHRTHQRSWLALVLVVPVLVLSLALTAFTPSNGNAKITWTPSSLDPTIAFGSVYTTTVKFTSSETIGKATLSLTPSLQELVVFSPSQFLTVTPGVAYTVRITVTVPAKANRPEYNGELSIREGNTA